DEGTGELAALELELVDSSGELTLPRPGRSREEEGRAAMDGNPFDPLDEGVELGVAGGDARLEERDACLLFEGEPGGELVVARQIEIDQAIRPVRHVLSPWR